MDENEKKPLRPPEVPKFGPPLPDFDDLPISAWLRTPPVLPKGQKHNALYDAEVIKAIYDDFYVGG